MILALVSQILVSATQVGGLLGTFATNGIWAAAILMSAGFFLSAVARNAVRPTRFIVALYPGAVSLGIGVVSLGLSLLTG